MPMRYARARARAPDHVRSDPARSPQPRTQARWKNQNCTAVERAGRGPSKEDKPIHPRLERRERKKLG